MKAKHFSQYELEHAVYQQVPYGGESHIAHALGVSPGMLSQYLNPSDDRESPVYKAAAIIAALMEEDEEAGAKVLELFCYFVNRSRQGRVLDVKATRARAYKEDAEAKIADANGDVDKAIRELEESIEADKIHLSALRAQRQAVNGNVRAWSKEVVKGRR